jgi:hypothetical protein
MNSLTRLTQHAAILALAASALLPSMASAQQAPQAGSAPGKWQFGAELYAYVPKISTTGSFPTGSAAATVNLLATSIIDEVNGGFMGSFSAHNGRWGVFTDYMYLNVGGARSQARDASIGGVGLPASASAEVGTELKGSVWTLAGQYRVANDPAWTVDLLAGARLLDVTQKTDWTLAGNLGPIVIPSRSGSAEISGKVWDGIIGVRGRYAFGADRKWSVPYYLDVGTGQSERTWQAAVGLGYEFGWGQVIAMWRYLDYGFKSDKRVQDINFNGPMIGAAFRW